MDTKNSQHRTNQVDILDVGNYDSDKLLETWFGNISVLYLFDKTIHKYHDRA